MKSDMDQEHITTGTFFLPNLPCRDESVYEGQWNKGLKHGVGKLTFPNGNFFVGQYLHGLKHGQGKQVNVGSFMFLLF